MSYRAAPSVVCRALPAVQYSLDGLSACGLAALCATNRSMHLATGDLVRVAGRMQHGIAAGGDLTGVSDLRALEKIPGSCSFDLRRRSGRRVLSGNDLQEICVGAYDAVLTTSHYPPAQGDAWEAEVSLQRGTYAAKVSGWCNPSRA